MSDRELLERLRAGLLALVAVIDASGDGAQGWHCQDCRVPYHRSCRCTFCGRLVEPVKAEG